MQREVQQRWGEELRANMEAERAEGPSEGIKRKDRSSPSGQGVLDGVGERVAQVQRACHVGGWDAHHEDAPGVWC